MSVAVVTDINKVFAPFFSPKTTFTELVYVSFDHKNCATNLIMQRKIWVAKGFPKYKLFSS